MAEVEQWQPGLDFLCTASVALKPKWGQRSELHRRPRTLLCHDMKGGYLEDRFVQGVNTTNCYRFYYWGNVDVFVYFSHYFVTIPPPGWTNAGHSNGVPVLGTFITEWDSGKEICEGFLETESVRHRLVRKLVRIANYYRFDGWLINIENDISMENVPNLVAFVKELTEAMAVSSPFSLVIWYDSVTVSGELDWQNELNDKNRQYFDVCDGIFLNYTWKEENLERSRQAAGQRYYDVYVGVDVFGRGCKGGGGFNTIEAVQAARTYDLSIALFGPGWAFEKFGNENFLDNEKQFWELVNVGCPPRKLTCLPFVSTFCQGWGETLHVNGQILSTGPWTNMCQQNLQPLGPQIGIRYDQSDVFCGGGSLRLTSTEIQKPVNVFKLFEADIPISRSSDFYVSYTYTTGSAQSALMFELFSGTTHYLIFSKAHLAGLFLSSSHSPESCIFLSQLADDKKPRHILQQNSSSTEAWHTDWFIWNAADNYQLKSISVLLQSDGPYAAPTSLCLGSLRLLTPQDLQIPAIYALRALDISCIFADSGTTITTSLTLTWKCNMDVDYFIPYYENDSQWIVLGSISTTAFRICNLVCKKASCRFKIQGVYCAGASIPLTSAPSILVIFERNSYNVLSQT